MDTVTVNWMWFLSTILEYELFSNTNYTIQQIWNYIKWTAEKTIGTTKNAVDQHDEKRNIGASILPEIPEKPENPEKPKKRTLQADDKQHVRVIRIVRKCAWIGLS